MGKGDNNELEKLRSVDPRTWTVNDVGKWLDFIDLGIYRISFIENEISGEEIFELENNELTAIGMKKLGHRKKFLRKVKALQKMENSAFDDRDNGGSSSGDSPSSSSKNSSHADLSGKRQEGKSKPKTNLTFKGKWEGSWVIIKMDSGADLSSLKKKVKREVKRSVDVYYMDRDGDEIKLRKSRDLKNAVDEAEGGTVRLVFKLRAADERSKSKSQTSGGVSARDAENYDRLMDGVAVIDTKGVIVFWNAAAERMFGFSKSEAVGENIKIIQQESDAESHDFYLWRYMKEHKARIVGKEGRTVIGRHKTGRSVPVNLSVVEGRAANGDYLFTGTMKKVMDTPSTLSSFSLLDHLLQAAIVIDSDGVILYLNRMAQNLLGYLPSEVVGRKVNMLMPPPYSVEHDSYLRNYLETGQSKIIGTSRDVVALHKDGSPRPVNLSLSVTNDGSKIYFTGILQSLEERDKTVATGELFVNTQRSVLNSLIVPAILIDAKGTVLVFNKAACDLFAYSSDQVVGRNVCMLMPTPEREKHDGYLRAYARRKGTNSNVVGVGRDVVGVTSKGTMIPLHLSVTENKSGKGESYFSGILIKV